MKKTNLIITMVIALFVSATIPSLIAESTNDNVPARKERFKNKGENGAKKRGVGIKFTEEEREQLKSLAEKQREAIKAINADKIKIFEGIKSRIESEIEKTADNPKKLKMLEAQKSRIEKMIDRLSKQPNKGKGMQKGKNRKQHVEK